MNAQPTSLGLELTGLYDCARIARELGISRDEADAVAAAIDHPAGHLHADDLTVALEAWTTYPDDWPAADPTSVYIARRDDGEVLYVGITGKRLQRLHAHAKAAEWWPTAGTVTLEHYRTREVAEARERQLIRRLDPHHNVQHRVQP